MIHLLREPATQKQIRDMLDAHESFIKLAVDIERGVLAGGGEFHVDCEAALVEAGSSKRDVWGADWAPDSDEIKFGAMINSRPKENRAMDIQDKAIRRRVEQVIRQLLRSAS